MTKVKSTVRQLDGTTLHQKILGDIERKIVSGEWAVGHRIPERVKKSGSFVSQPHTQSAVLEIGEIRREVESLKLPYAFKLIKAEHRKAVPADLVLLDIAAGAPLLQVVCVHTAGGRPFCLEQRLINLVTVPDAGSVAFKDVPPSQWLLSQIPWTSAEHRIHAVAADGDAAAALDISAGSACLVVERRTWSGSGSVTHVRLTYPGDRHALVATFTPISEQG